MAHIIEVKMTCSGEGLANVKLQEAQLSQRGRAMTRVVEYFEYFG